MMKMDMEIPATQSWPVQHLLVMSLGQVTVMIVMLILTQEKPK